jgi:hypothetical protein
MPGGNFDEQLNVGADGVVIAAGPLDESVAEVTEMCVWVLQRDGAEDAIGNAMGPPNGMPDMAHMPDMPDMHGGLTVTGLGTPNARWTFPLADRLKPVDFRAGSATALAIGVFLDEQRMQRAFFWSEPVRLSVAGTAASG